jgi:hypothetical protein
VEEWEETASDGLKVTIRETDRGDTVETAALHNENFGGFSDKGLDGPYTARFRAKRKRRPGIGHNRPPVRLLECRRLVGGAGPAGWAGIQPSGPPPSVCQAIRQTEQSVPPCLTPERDRAEEQERLEWRIKQLDEPTDPNAGTSASFARGILREERLQLLAQHTERRIQALYCQRYKPSRGLEAKRFPKLPVVATKLLPKEARRQPAAERRAELNVLVANYLARGGEIAICPPETTSAQLKKQKPQTKMGRPLVASEEQVQHILKLRKQGKSIRRIADDLGLGRGVVERTIAKHKPKWKQPTPAAPLQLATCPAPRLRP